MARKRVPPSDIPPLNPDGTWQADYYDLIKCLDDLNAFSPRQFNTYTGSTYTFVIGDAGDVCEFTNATAMTVTVPPSSTVGFPIGTQIDVQQGGAGKVTFAQGAGVTIKSVSSFKSLSAQEAGGILVKVATDTWRLTGSLIA